MHLLLRHEHNGGRVPILRLQDATSLRCKAAQISFDSPLIRLSILLCVWFLVVLKPSASSIPRCVDETYKNTERCFLVEPSDLKVPYS